MKRVIQDLVKIVADELGITDALNCFTNGDISSCVATGVTVLSSFAGGMAGKLLAKYGSPWKWKKGAELAGRIKDLVGEAIDGIKGWRKAEEELACAVGNSFVPGTLVLLADGSSEPIEKLKLGDQVAATDPATGKTKAQPVAATIIGQGGKQLVELALTTTGVSGATHTAKVTATDGHPFYLPLRGAWVDAGDLIAGDQLQALNPKQVTRVTSVRHYTALARVHNLTIATIHTYYVLAGATPVLVHNCAAPNIRISPAASDWATKGAHMHVGSSEVRVFPNGDGGVGFEGIRLSNGMASARDVATARGAVMNNPGVRADLIDKARSAMADMNDHNWGNSLNRAPEMHFLIKALEKIE